MSDMEVARRAVPLGSLDGAAVAEHEDVLEALRFEQAVRLLQDRFGAEPPERVVMLSERRESLPTGAQVIRRVMRLQDQNLRSWASGLAWFVSLPPFLELHEDIVISPSQQVAVSRLWNGNFRGSVHFQQRVVMSPRRGGRPGSSAGATVLRCRFEAVGQDMVGGMLVGWLPAHGGTMCNRFCQDLVEQDALVRTAARWSPSATRRRILREGGGSAVLDPLAGEPLLCD